jgi:hypothetical protein
MARAISIMTPFPGVDFSVGTLTIHTSDPERRNWTVSAIVNTGKHQNDKPVEIALGDYSPGLRVSESLAKGDRRPLVWDVMQLALYSDEDTDFLDALAKYWPGYAERIQTSCFEAEGKYYSDRGTE